MLVAAVTVYMCDVAGSSDTSTNRKCTGSISHVNLLPHVRVCVHMLSGPAAITDSSSFVSLESATLPGLVAFSTQRIVGLGIS